MVHRLAILGHPLGHSLSPVFHRAALASCDLQGTYEALDIPPGDLTRIWHERLRDGYTGFNVTIPHKVPIAAMCDSMSDTARATGAVNTLVRRGDVWEGHNTDVVGLHSVLSPFRDRIAGADAAVIGAGGSARAAVSVLVNMGIARMHVVSRDPARARQLSIAHTGGEAAFTFHDIAGPDTAGVVRHCALLMQMTPVGMHPRPGERVLSGAEIFRKGQIVFDAVYRPRRTRFLAEAGEAGAVTIDGLGMFLHQGAASFELWTGQKPPLDPLTRTIEHELTET